MKSSPIYNKLQYYYYLEHVNRVKWIRTENEERNDRGGNGGGESVYKQTEA